MGGNLFAGFWHFSGVRSFHLAGHGDIGRSSSNSEVGIRKCFYSVFRIQPSPVCTDPPAGTSGSRSDGNFMVRMPFGNQRRRVAHLTIKHSRKAYNDVVSNQSCPRFSSSQPPAHWSPATYRITPPWEYRSIALWHHTSLPAILWGWWGCSVMEKPH